MININRNRLRKILLIVIVPLLIRNEFDIFGHELEFLFLDKNLF
jgi:hypothetical protein